MVARKFRRRSRGKRRKRLLRAAVFALLILLAVMGFEHKISVFSRNYFPSFARQVTSKAVCEAVEGVLAQGGYTYGDFAVVKYASGKVAAVETDTANINVLKSRVVAAAEEKAEEIHNSVMYIPLGAFTGLSLISNYGPKIPLSYCLTGSFSAELVSSFETAGFNQTLHRISLTVTAEIVTASVDFDDTLTFKTNFEVAQSVIVGEIPSTVTAPYFQRAY